MIKILTEFLDQLWPGIVSDAIYDLQLIIFVKY